PTDPLGAQLGVEDKELADEMQDSSGLGELGLSFDPVPTGMRPTPAQSRPGRMTLLAFGIDSLEPGLLAPGQDRLEFGVPVGHQHSRKLPEEGVDALGVLRTDHLEEDLLLTGQQ